ncbi:MAG: DUF4922 domain-containing protein [Bacteroides sp.]|nr:DUF4922 domain-containing protein [Bacteroides sp.]
MKQNQGLFLESELAAWPMAAENFARIRRAVDEGNRLALSAPSAPWHIEKMAVNHRRASTTAKTDAASVAARPCFLCPANRPANQSALRWRDFEILVNPFPLSAQHFTIASTRHEPQSIGGRFEVMAHLAREMEGMCVFYNGPRCGASAPDHLHFQAVAASDVSNLRMNIAKERIEGIGDSDEATLSLPPSTSTPFPFFIIESTDDKALSRLSERIIDALGNLSACSCGEEPPVNVAMLYDLPSGTTLTYIIPRSKHRPAIYGNGEGQMLVSPATIEMLGTVVCSRHDDFNRLDLPTATAILREVGLPHEDMKKAISYLMATHRRC